MKLLDIMPELKACIFDLDGTLLDSMNLWQDIDKEYLKKHGILFDTSYSDVIKNMSFDESAKFFIKEFHIKKSEAEIKSDWNAMAEDAYRYHIKEKKGCIKLLSELKKQGILMCIATSCNKQHAEMALSRLNMLSYFSFIMTCSEVGKNKEHPDIFLQCAKRMHVEPSQCCLFDDLYNALKTAHKEHFLTAGVYDQLSEKEEDKKKRLCHIYVNDFEELI